MMKLLEMRAWNIKENRWATMEELLGEIPVSATVRPPSILTCGGDGWDINLFTGRTDIDGKKIYKEDLIEYDNELIFIVKYDNNTASYYLHYAKCNKEISPDNCDDCDGCLSFHDLQEEIDKYRVVGNKFENPEFIK